jgi:AraC-like DNA-binding protein
MSAFIRYHYFLDHTNDASNASFQRITPDGSTDLVLYSGCPLRRQQNGAIQFLDSSYASSRLSEPYFIQRTGAVHLYGICFYPWGLRPFMQGSASFITNDAVSLNNVLGKNISQLEEMISPVMDDQSIIEITEQFFASRLYAPCNTDPLAASAARWIISKRGILKTDELTSLFNIGKRRMEQRFNEAIGVAPKQFARLIKFKEALRLLSGIPSNGAGLASLAGYCDQSHFIHDCKAFTGLTPGQYIREKHPLNDLIQSFAKEMTD